MIKVVTAIKRCGNLSVDEFQSHWLQRHAEVVMRLPGIVRYHQSHLRSGAYRKGEPAYDGIAEVWFEELSAMRALTGSAAHDALLEDEERFIDRRAMVTLLTTEYEAKAGSVPADAVKCFELVRRRHDLSPAAFQRYWQAVHGPLAAGIPTLLRYVQAAPRLGGYANGRELAFDGVASTWFADIDAMRRAAGTPAYAKTRVDEQNFIAPEPHVVLLTREHVIQA